MLVQFIILGYFNLTDLPFCCKKDAIIVYDYDFIGSFDQKQKLINHKYSEAVDMKCPLNTSDPYRFVKKDYTLKRTGIICDNRQELNHLLIINWILLLL